MKKDWQTITLEEACENLFAGGDVPKGNHSKAPSEKYKVPIFSNGEKNKGLYGYTNKARVTKPSLTISARGTIGYSEIRYEPFYPAVRLIVATPKEDVLDVKFLKYIINNFDFVHSGSSIPQLTVPMVKSHQMNLPPLLEQKRIVKILDEKFEAIEESKKISQEQLASAKELFESRLNEIFVDLRKNTDIKKFGEVCDFVRGPFGGSLKKSFFKKEGIAVYEQRHAIYNQFDNIRYYIDEKKFKEMSRFELVSGDLIMSCSGTMGKVAIVPEDVKKGIINQALLKLTPDKSLLSSNYLKMWMESGDFQKSLSELTVGAAIKNVASVKILKDISIPLPNLKMQAEAIKEIDDFFEKTKELQAIFQSKIADLEELKKSYLHEAFSGKL